MAKYPQKEETNDIVHFNIVPVPRVSRVPTPNDIVTFRIPGRNNRTPS